MNCDMNNLEKTLMELHGMLKTNEASMVKPSIAISTTLIVAIREGGIKRKKTSYPQR